MAVNSKQRKSPQRKGKDFNTREKKAVKTEFFIDSLSALQEYDKHSPECVMYVSYRSGEAAKATSFRNELPIRSFEAIEEELPPSFQKSNFVAKIQVSPLEERVLLENMGKRSSDLIVVLDHITDPRNLGAIARTAAFFGVKNIVVPKDRQVLLTDSAISTSQGAFSLGQLTIVTNLSSYLVKAKKLGYWVLGTDMNAGSFKEPSLAFEKTILVLGSEEKGISRLIQKHCDAMVTIPGAKKALQSLNVSVAAGILLQHFSQRP